MEMKIRDYPDNRNIHDVQQEVCIELPYIYRMYRLFPPRGDDGRWRMDGRTADIGRRGRDSAREQSSAGPRVRESAEALWPISLARKGESEMDG